MLAFPELFGAPTGRHVFSLSLAAFIDVIIILIAFGSSGAPESQWASGAAALDSLDAQVFARDLLRKIQVAPNGLARIPDDGLSPGETQLLLLLSNRGLATYADGGSLLDPAYPGFVGGGFGRSRCAAAGQSSGRRIACRQIV